MTMNAVSVCQEWSLGNQDIRDVIKRGIKIQKY